ncbi:hypothetical protein CH333_02630 [candidate division WOR-3 bacterium JGI_Cruoil_03_44_89]|uniref:YXWGXW repeat-containing protein n=1 Tax=candidate division WOR-3 bacterium JGI_Cruoil_03_44_89 TaxID=1973748 RepID=A0A235BXB1_UNCW3|nr:MAG: hypothetical protein CH333_02630 [candidate division WOR-3 bacterium JGI_Cruoil_03_44_89]
MKKLMALLLLGTFLISCAPRTVVVMEEPPAARVEVKTACPGANYVWKQGHWAWKHGTWVWLPGHWEKRPKKNATWVPGHWKKKRGGWFWVPGHWK